MESFIKVLSEPFYQRLFGFTFVLALHRAAEVHKHPGLRLRSQDDLRSEWIFCPWLRAKYCCWRLMRQAARGLGASLVSAFFRVTLPLSMPGVSVAAALTVLWSASAFLGPYRAQLTPLVFLSLSRSLPRAALTALMPLTAAIATAMALVRSHFGWKDVWELTPLRGSHLSFALAHSVLAIPVPYLVLRASLKQVDPNLEAAAQGLGAGAWQVFRFVTLRLIMPAALAATLFALVISLNEITLTLFLALTLPGAGSRGLVAPASKGQSLRSVPFWKGPWNRFTT